MSTTEASRPQDGYALGRTPEEYERLRAQARVWESATGRLLDQVGLAPGASCLDAGCGPGETMRLMAQRVGPAGRVLGVDVDASLGAQALAMLHERRSSSVRVPRPATSTAGEPIPGAPFDLVYARLLLFHLPERVAVLARLWDAVAPGGHLLVQDYDLRSVGVLPAARQRRASWCRVVIGAFTAVGCDVHVGARLPQLFAQAGIGDPDGTDVSGRHRAARLGPRACSSHRPQPAADRHRARRHHRGGCRRDAGRRSAATPIGFPDRPVLWPLLIGAWKRKERPEKRPGSRSRQPGRRVP